MTGSMVRVRTPQEWEVIITFVAKDTRGRNTGEERVSLSIYDYCYCHFYLCWSILILTDVVQGFKFAACKKKK